MIVSNLLLNTSGDLDLSNGLRLVTGSQAVAQRLGNAFRFFLGEWFLDTRLGVPYYELILRKGTDLRIVSQIFRDIITRDPEVDSVIDFRMSFDPIERVLTVQFEARLISGDTIGRGIADIPPLLIDLTELGQ